MAVVFTPVVRKLIVSRLETIVTFKKTGWYLNFGTWFMNNILLEHKKITL
jgi:hypothetical protein